MSRQHGYGAWTDRVTGNVTQEFDTRQCRHCQRHIFVKPGTLSTVYLIPDMRPGMFGKFIEEPGAGCTICGGPVCLPCHDIGTCSPFMEQIARSETEMARRDIRARLGLSGACNEGPA